MRTFREWPGACALAGSQIPSVVIVARRAEWDYNVGGAVRREYMANIMTTAEENKDLVRRGDSTVGVG